MLNIALIRNPIQPDKREDHSAKHVPGQNLQEYVEPILADWPGTEFVISVNGNVIEKDDVPLFYPAVGDYVILMPVVGKGFFDILKSVLMIALVAWAGPAGLAMAGTTTATVMSGIYTGLIIGVGGAILNAIIPTTQEAAYDPAEMSTSYGWNGSVVTEIPGTPVGRIYGTVCPTLVRLQRHISTDGSSQYLNYLFSCGMGPADSIQDMEIAGNPIANYDDVEYWTRLGNNDQETIENFRTNYDDYPLSYELDNDSAWHTQRTEGNAVEGLEVVLQFPGGLYYVEDSGGVGSASVTIECHYKKVSDIGWIEMIPTTIIRESSNDAIFKTFRVDNIEPGQYDVRMRCTAKSGTSTRHSTRVYWVQLSEINYADFCYPNLVLWGVRIKATSQLSGGDPEFKCTVTRSKVWIWNPYALAYEQKRATNPFWAGYDLLHHCEYLKNIQTGNNEYYVEGVAARRFDYDQFKLCADYADGVLASGKLRFELNLFVEGSISVKEALNQIAMVGRGVFLPRGTRFSCICDMPMEMTTVFGDGRIATGSMVGEWQGIENRSRAVEVTFWNKENRYRKDMAPYQSPSYNEDGMIPNPTQLTYKGITDYEHAYREAAFVGRCNEYKKRTKSWQSDIDAIGCMVGDVVGVQTSTSRWGVGGRIVSATANTVTLDRSVSLVAGQAYKIYLTLSDDTIVQKNVEAVTSDIETNVLTITEEFETLPEKFDLYAMGTSLALMRILSIVRANDLKAKITAEQYFSEIYEEDISIPELNYSDFSIKLLSISTAEQLPRPSTSLINVMVSWNGPRDSRAGRVKIFANDTLKHEAYGNTSGHTVITIGAGPSYLIRVDANDAFGNLVATGQTTYEPSYVVPQVSALNVIQAHRETGATISYELTISWDTPDPRSYASADVYMRSSIATEEEVGELTPKQIGNVPVERIGLDVVPWKQIGNGNNKFTFAGAVFGATYKFMVVARDRNGVSADSAEAPTIEHIVVVKPYTPIQPSGLSLAVSDKAYCSWAANTDTDVDFYELRTDNNPGAEVNRVYRGSALQCNPDLTSRTGTLYLFAHNPSGKYSPALSYAYSFAAPVAPTVTVRQVFQGIIIQTNAYPNRVLSLNVHINDGSGEAIYSSRNNTYSHVVESGIFSISAAFVDYFGEGALSGVQEVTLAATIDPDLIAAESLSLAKMEEAIQESLAAGEAGYQNSIDIVAEMGKPLDQCSYTAIAQALTAINLRAVKAELISQINLCPESILLKSSLLHLAGDTLIDDNLIVGRMISAGAISADKISSLLGVTIPQSDGSATKFESDGINWYTPGGVKHGAVRRAVQGTALNGKFVEFSTPWTKKPFILLTPKSVQSMVSGYTNSNLQIVCEPYSNDPVNDPDMKTGFRIRLETRVLDGSGGSIIDLSLPSNGSEQTSPNTPLATKDLYATVEVDLGTYTAGYYVATNPDHNLWHNRQVQDENEPYSLIRDDRGYVSQFYSNQYPQTHSINMNTEHTHDLETYAWYGGTWTWINLPGGFFTHYHRQYVDEVYTYGTITLNFYYRLVGETEWRVGGSKTFTNQYGVLSHTQTLATGETPGQYQIKVVRASSSGTVNSAKFKSYAVNGGGVIASTGEVSFLAIESDGNSFYTVEN